MSSDKAHRPFPSDTSRPMVARHVSSLGVWLFVAVLIVAAILLFSALNAHRARISAPSIGPGSADNGTTIASPPELSVPRFLSVQSAPMIVPFPAPTAQPVIVQPAQPSPGRHVAPDAEPPIAIKTPVLQLPSAMPIPSNGPQIIYEASRNTQLPVSRNGEGSGKEVERVEAGHFANPATTVPKGTVIQAVLESALDSTRAGFARAIISRDVFGFDGTHVLIPRGSRLIGDYKSDLATGQRRALIEWQRLMRPDGVIIDLQSPSADPLGRAGVEGKVNSHFIQRFAGAMLQSSLSIGSAVGVSKLAGSAAIVAVPLGQQATPLQLPDKVQPTLTVRQGTSISVFVARDLDFTSVEQ